MRWGSEDVVNIDDMRKKKDNVINDEILFFNWSADMIFMLMSNVWIVASFLLTVFVYIWIAAELRISWMLL